MIQALCILRKLRVLMVCFTMLVVDNFMQMFRAVCKLVLEF